MIILENTETGESREMKPGEIFRLPWRIKPQAANVKREAAKPNVAMQKLAAAAASFGIPAHLFQQVGGWLLGCVKCTATAEITKLFEQGKITEAEHKDLFVRAANAFDQRDEYALLELKGKLEALRR